MNRELLKEVIIHQNKTKFYKKLGIERENLGLIKTYIKLPHALIISGIRRCGKSTFLAQIASKYYNREVYYVNFDDERLVDFTVKDFNTLHEILMEVFDSKKIFFLDEIQNVAQWELFVRRMIDDGYKFFITGSNATLLSKELGTRLTGRNMTLALYPFSFKEFLKFHGIEVTKDSFYLSEEKAKIKRYFALYLSKGGMPEYLQYNDENVVTKVYEDILYRDIVARYEIKDVKALRELTLYLLSNIGSEYSYNRLKDMIHLKSENTVKNYLDYLESSFLFFTVNKFSYSVRNQYLSQKKIYCIDNGMVDSVGFKFSGNQGRYLENSVALELKKRFKELYYYKTSKNFEVDFLGRDKNRKMFLFQVCQNIDSKTTREREIRGLMETMQELKLQEGTILSGDTNESFVLDHKKITIKPVYQWLLND
jgi:predicted AAA+ superfamily ATPase